MGSIFGSHYINRALLPIVLTSFTMTYAVPLPAIEFNINLGDAAFMVRLEKLVEKLVKSEKKGVDSMIEYLVDIKNEIETTYNTTLNIDTYIDQVGKEIQKQSGKYPKKELDAIKKKIKGRDKKHKNHARYVADVMYLENYQMNEFDENMYHMAKHSRDKDKDDDKKEEVVIPALLVYGVTCSLCGLFLMIIPIPACKDWGARMVVAGVTACANSICSKTDENNKKDKEKK